MKLLQRLLVWTLIGLLLSCGGGGAGGGGGVVASEGGGVGTGGTGIFAGTVTGLGSVIVDGTRFDESQALLESRPDLVRSVPLTLAELQVGQYAYLDLDAAGAPTRVRISSQLVGAIADVDAAAGRFTVWGVPVALNADAGVGPVTVVAGYASRNDLRSGDPVQVYGVLQAGDNGADTIRATRVERLPAVGALPARLTGTLQRRNGNLLLAGRPLDVSAAVAPPLSDGMAVTAVVPWSATLPARWQASAVALLAPAASASVTVSGAVHLLPAGGAVVQGLAVDGSGLSQDERDALREGSYLTVSGRSRGPDDLVAASVQGLPQGGRSAQVRGSITQLTGPTSFVVRGQPVDAASARFEGGTAADLAVGLYVEVDGVQGASDVVATRVTLPASPPDRAALEITGVVQSVDAASRQVLVQEDGRTLTLVLPAGAVLPAIGQTVRAEGYWDGSTLQVRKIEPREDHSGSGR